MQGHEFSAQDADLLETIMRWRRDVRGNRFQSEPVPTKLLNRILAAATLAPSVGYSQPWEFVVVQNPQLKARVRNSFDQANTAARSCFSGDQGETYARLKLEGISEAPVNVAVFYREPDGPVLGQTAMAEVGRYSVVCAVQNMWLMARTLNIGMGWVSILDPEEVRNILAVPPDRTLVAYLCLGFVDRFEPEPELRRLRWADQKQLENLVHMDQFASD